MRFAVGTNKHHQYHFTELPKGLKVSHPRCVVKIQVREEYPIFVQSQNTTKRKTKFITLLKHYNNMFRPKLSAIFRLYMKPI